MPRDKSKNSKSQAIREVLEQNPKATAKAVVELLAQKGISVKSSLVYMVKGSMKSRARRRRKSARAAAVISNSTMADPVDLIRKVKGLAHEAGGMKKLKELVLVLAE